MDSLVELTLVKLAQIRGSLVEGRICPVKEELSCHMKLKELLGLLVPELSSQATHFSLTQIINRCGLLLSYKRSIGRVTALLNKERDDFLKRYWEFCDVFGITYNNSDQQRMFELCSFLVLHNDLINQFKYSINVLFDRHFHSGAPSGNPRFFGLFLFHWKFQYFFQRLAHRRKGRIIHEKLTGAFTNSNLTSSYVVYSLFQGLKKGLLPLSYDKVGESLKKHRDTLTKDTTKVDQGLKTSVSKKITEFMKEFRLNRLGTNVQTFGISARATVESGVMDGGSVGFLGKLMEEGECEDDEVYETCPDSERELLEVHCISYLRCPEFLGYAHINWMPIEIYAFGPSDRDLMEVEKRFHDYRPKYIKSVAVPSCILEPMKVRIITKPNAGQFIPMHSIQKKLWSSLFNHESKTFELIGRTLSDDMIVDFVAKQPIKDQEFWVSGDYSQATDMLKTWITKMLVEFLFGHLKEDDEELYWRIKKSLVGCEIRWDVAVPSRECEWFGLHKKLAKELEREQESEHKKDLKYVMKTYGVPLEFEDLVGDALNKSTGSEAGDCPDPTDPLEQWRDQWNLKRGIQTQGQLMGNVLSFPILCMTNFISYWCSLEDVQGHAIPIRDVFLRSPVRINGDDILFKSNPQHYDAWMNRIPDFGFCPSPGKNLTSPHILQINSQLYEVRTLSNFETIVRKIHYLNWGLVTSRKKNDCSNDLSTSDVKARVAKVLDQAREEDQNLPPVFSRIKSFPDIFRDIFYGMPEFFKDRSFTLLKSHLEIFHDMFPQIDFAKMASIYKDEVPIHLHQVNLDLMNKIFRLEVSVERSNFKRFAIHHSSSKLIQPTASIAACEVRLKKNMKLLRHTFKEVALERDIFNLLSFNGCESVTEIFGGYDNQFGIDVLDRTKIIEVIEREVPLRDGRGKWDTLDTLLDLQKSQLAVESLTVG